MSDHITPKECQKVAEKLREAGRELDGDSTSSIRSAFCEIDHIIGTQDTGRTFEPFFNRLADLIDPTCHQVIEDETQVCSVCSGDLDEGYGWDFCPWCGSRVVIEDA